MNYIALIRKDANSDFGVEFPDFPGCVTAGTSLDEAKDMAVEALAFHIDGMIADGETLPGPSNLETVMADRHNKDAVAWLVSTDQKGKAVRVNITIQEPLLNRIDAAAKDKGLTRSGFIAEASVRVLEDG